MPHLVLYNLDISTCSQKVRLCLAEKGLSYENRAVNLAADEHLEPWYLALNPNGVVPTLTVDGVPVIDSSAICEFLDEAYPGPALSPADPLERARMRGWMRFLEEVPTVAIRVPSLNRIFGGVYVGREQAFAALADRRPLRRELYQEMGVKGFNEEKVRESLARLRETLRRADNAIAAHGPWLLGPDFSLADILLIPTVVRMDDLGMSEIWSSLAGVRQWFDAVQRRHSFATAFTPGSRLRPDSLDRYREALG